MAWKSKTIGDVADVIAGQSPDGKHYNAEGKGMPFYQGKKDFGDKFIEEPTTWTTDITRVAVEGDVLLSVRAPVGPINFSTQEACIGRGLAAIRPKPGLNRDFLFNFLLHKRDEIEGTEGAVFASINKRQIEAIEIAVPPLPEQQRIVGILDEAFAGIATAKANAEKNLRNARSLFESHLEATFTTDGRGAASTLGDVCSFVGGSQPPKSVFEKTSTPKNIRLIQIRDYKSDKHIVYIPRSLAKRFCTADDAMIGRYGPPLFQILRGLDGAYNVALMKAVPDESKVSRDFLFYFLKNSSILEYVIFHSSRTAGQTGVTKETLEPYPINVPPLAEQKAIVENIRSLELETQRLASLYQQKLAALDALKKSLLHQAFSGQLTASQPMGISAASVPLQRFSGLPPDHLHAAVVAISYRLHEERGNTHEFGHVYAEKTVQMVEAHLLYDLARDPKKMAAGPLDFAKRRYVDRLAKQRKWFSFEQTDTGRYVYEPLGSVDFIIEHAKMMLGPTFNELEAFLKWMLPLKWQQAEIVATVYAGWNNLLLDRQQPTDEQIVYESRENWHKDKLKIERNKFFSAIEWLRKEGVVPMGEGKRVNAKKA